jgi:hypothetical protein
LVTMTVTKAQRWQLDRSDRAARLTVHLLEEVRIGLPTPAGVWSLGTSA